MEGPDPDRLLELVISGAKPACEITAPIPAQIRLANISGLEMYAYEYDGERFRDFAQKGRPVLPLVENAPALFQATGLAAGIEGTIAEMKEMTIIEAIKLMGEKFVGEPVTGGPHEQLLFGLIFGYPPCCVRYLVQKIHRKIRHAHEAHSGIHYYLRCEDCSKKDVWLPSWCHL